MSEIYRFADFELDTALFQVRHQGQVESVQPQVFDVLRYLIEHRDRIVSKDELLEQVWSGRFISDATLSSRIKACRQLIGDSGDRQALIRTVRNRGFRFVGQVEVRLTDARRITQQDRPAPDDGMTTVAVLPFESYDEESDDAHFGEGIAADIIALLAQQHWLRVISRGSSFRYSAAAESPQEIGAALGVRYLLMGRVRQHGGRIRIDAELADCETEAHLWSRSYDNDRSDLFSLQEDISQQIAATIAPELSLLEGRRNISIRATDVDAWSHCHKGFWHLYRFTTDELEQARASFLQALEIDDRMAHAHAGLAYVSIQLAFYGAPGDRSAELEKALVSAQRAVELDQWDAFNHFVLGRTHSLLLRFDEARSALELAIDLSPSFAQAYFGLGFSFTNSGRAADAIPLYDKAASLSPRDPHLWTFHHMRGMAHFRLGELDDAERFVRESVRAPNATYWPFATLCALLGTRGRHAEARAIADRLRQMKPQYSLEFALQDFFFSPRDAFVESFVAGLQAAGFN